MEKPTKQPKTAPHALLSSSLMVYRGAHASLSREELVNQGWAVIFPEGPLWVLNLDEGVVQLVRESNSLNEDRRLTKIMLDGLLTEKTFWRACKLV